ncbi:hypothetical protein D920_00274 [Enterococcus faecalis 13-SD-W-01]|nr:hypothetical protein D920_00274 [Enterococcus faecalis 13-SD-W-01]
MLKIILIVTVIAVQTFFGYIESKLLGAILPVISVGLYIYLLFSGVLDFSLITFILPLVGLFSLVGLWVSGRNAKHDKQKKELDKMKAKDNQ